MPLAPSLDPDEPRRELLVVSWRCTLPFPPRWLYFALDEEVAPVAPEFFPFLFAWFADEPLAPAFLCAAPDLPWAPVFPWPAPAAPAAFDAPFEVVPPAAPALCGFERLWPAPGAP